MPESTMYLGRIERVVAGTYALLQPLYRATAHAEAWQLVTDQRGEFPNRGRVTWLKPPTVVEGTLWVFDVMEQPTFDRSNPGHDRYKVGRPPAEAIEVLDLGNGDPEEARRWLTEEGIVLDFVPAQRLYLSVGDTTWLGPIQLVRVGQSDRWSIDSRRASEPLPCIAPILPTQFSEAMIDRSRTFLLPGAKPGPQIGQVDWSADASILERVLKALRRADREYTEALALTNKSIEHMVAVLESGGLAETGRMLETQRLQRARAIIERLGERQDLLAYLTTTLLDELLAVPVVADRITEAVDEARREIGATAQDVVDQARKDARSTLESELAEATSRLGTLRTQVEASEAELATIEREVAERRAELAQIEREDTDRRAALTGQVEALETTLAARVREIIARPEQLLSDVAILRAAGGFAAPAPQLGQLAHAAHTAGRPIYLPDWLRDSDDQLGRLSGKKDLKGLLPRELRTSGVSPRGVRALHAAFLSGAAPALAGDGAIDALEAYAANLAGGRALRLPISPAVLEPADLLGRADPASRRFVPQPGGLLDLLIHARGRSDLFLVILEGINRAAIDNFLTPLLACHADGQRGRASRALPLLHPSAIDGDDPYAATPWLDWPPNVLLAMTLAEGPTLLPLPSTMWSHALLLHLDDMRPTSERDDASADNLLAEVGERTLREVPWELWREWRAEMRSVDISAWAELLNQLTESGYLLPQDGKVQCARFYAALRSWPVEEAAALEETVVHCVVPQAAPDTSERLAEALQRVQCNSERVQRALSITGRTSL